jgi:hypothetical protein
VPHLTNIRTKKKMASGDHTETIQGKKWAEIITKLNGGNKKAVGFYRKTRINMLF